jgi:hypothetical protein
MRPAAAARAAVEEEVDAARIERKIKVFKVFFYF